MNAEGLVRLLARAGLPDAAPGTARMLTGGTYNALYQVRLDDGREVVVKIPPDAETPGLAYERNLLRGEEIFCRRAAAAAGVPVPGVLHAEDGFLVMTRCPGSSWHALSGSGGPEGAARARLRRDLGGHVARLHAVSGPGFGYPGAPLADRAAGWQTVFTAMTDAVLADAARYSAWLPRPAEAISRLFAANAHALQAVTRPSLVHFDLWDGNILLDVSSGRWEISALVDGERMFWGDPLADFVSPALLGDIEDDADFLAGYRAEDSLGVLRGLGPGAPDGAARTRLALYRGYLYLIMLVESVPRRYPPDRTARLREAVAPQLEAALKALPDG